MNDNQRVEASVLLPGLKKDIDEFVGDAPQFDDITMLMFDYKPSKGGVRMEEKTFPAKTDSLTDVLAFVEQALEAYECPMKMQMAICVAIEEVFVNVAHYAYGEGEGDVKFTIRFDERTAVYTADFLSQLDMAYAITVHKAQGSEYRAVVLVSAPAAPSLMVRGVLYTAITRARTLLIIVGREEVVVTMTENAKRNRRYTGLKLRLQGRNE